VLTTLFYAIAREFVPRGEREVVAQTTFVSIKKALPTPAPAPARAARRVLQHQSAPARTPRHEIAKETVLPAPHEPSRRSPSIPSKFERDEAGFAREVAQLNEQNDPHSIPTIDPASQESPTKTYAFKIPSSLRGDEQGNGIITPVQTWRQDGRDCYYGRYEFTYPDGSMESGNIVWPFCFDPGADPFKEPPHPIPFPLPIVGFKLPADAQMPPIEKEVYQQWASANAAASTP
jgi:hypothetical protein